MVACCPGPLIDHVLAGELTVRIEGPLRVARAGTAATPGPVEEVAPGTEIVLRAGDTALYDQASPAEYANRGTEPVQLVGGGLFLGETQPVPPPGYLLNNFDAIFPAPPLPAGAITFSLERVTLAPSAMLPGPAPGALQAVTSGPQVAYLPEASDGSITNLTREPVVAYVLTLLQQDLSRHRKPPQRRRRRLRSGALLPETGFTRPHDQSSVIERGHDGGSGERRGARTGPGWRGTRRREMTPSSGPPGRVETSLPYYPYSPMAKVELRACRKTAWNPGWPRRRATRTFGAAPRGTPFPRAGCPRNRRASGSEARVAHTRCRGGVR